MDQTNATVGVMEACFNELSQLPFCASQDKQVQRIEDYIDTIKAASEKGFQKIRYDNGINNVWLSESYTLENYCIDHRRDSKTLLILATQKHPYIEEGSSAEDAFILDDIKLRKEKKTLDTYGFAAAHASNTICIGFCSETFWEKVLFSLLVTSANCTTEQQGICISTPAGFKTEEYLAWEADNTPIKILACSTLPHLKKINLRDDHGQDILNRFAKRIRKESYIIEIINSLPFNKHETKFIRRAYPDGLIEIVLTSTDSGYGMVVKTTARNQREVDWIAMDLENKYKDSQT